MYLIHPGDEMLSLTIEQIHRLFDEHEDPKGVEDHLKDSFYEVRSESIVDLDVLLDKLRNVALNNTCLQRKEG